MTDPTMRDTLAGIGAAVHALTDAGGLIDQLAELLGERGRLPETQTGHRPPGSRPPWDGQVANAYMDIHAVARDLEASLHTYVNGAYWRRWGGSDGHTRQALANVVVYVEHDNVPEAEVRWVARRLGRLVRMAQSVPAIDQAPAPAAALRQACPYCRTGSLEADLNSMEVYCSSDTCADPATGDRPRWDRTRLPFLLTRLIEVTP